MRIIGTTLLLFTFAITVYSQDRSREIQLMTAMLAAPEEMRENATIMGYSSDGELEIWRQGSNDLICLTDDPNREGINIACYHKDLNDFMERGRILRKEGKGRMEIFDIRAEEVAKGMLDMPEGPSSLFIFYGDDEIINWNTGEANGGKQRYVIYIPFATPESSGLPLKPITPGAPWLMDAGTYRAHIMITPQ